MPDIELSRPNRMRLVTALTNAFHTAERIDMVLDDIGFDYANRPPATGTPNAVWREVLRQLEQGAVTDGIRNLLAVTLTLYPENRAVTDIATQYAPDLLPPSTAEANGAAEEPATTRQPSLRLFVRATSQDEREKILRILRELGLAPEVDYFTSYVTRYTLAVADATAVGNALDGTELDWTVVPPGGPDYLLSELLVQGPDGRNFRWSDTPAATTVADIAAGTLANYPDDAGTRVAVTDEVMPGGEGRRLAPETNLHDAGIRDGGRLRVGYHANAGSVSPTFRDPALARAGNQIRRFAESRDGIGLVANSPDLATVFELEFTQRSFGSPPPGSDEPVVVEDHVVQIELGEKFPLAPPIVFWLSDIFHPNVFPNYECEDARRYPQRQGLVCLGELAEAWQPAMDLGRLCQMLLDMAAYRNYSILVATGRVDVADGQARDEYHGNVYDRQAAVWALTHEGLILAMGGAPVFQRAAASAQHAYHGVVEPYAP